MCTLLVHAYEIDLDFDTLSALRSLSLVFYICYMFDIVCHTTQIMITLIS
jgi:hypothetical protein